MVYDFPLSDRDFEKRLLHFLKALDAQPRKSLRCQENPPAFSQ